MSSLREGAVDMSTREAVWFGRIIDLMKRHQLGLHLYDDRAIFTHPDLDLRITVPAVDDKQDYELLLAALQLEHLEP